MVMIKKCIIERARKKALQSCCRYNVSALGFNKKGELIYSSVNKPRFAKERGGTHAEMQVMLRAKPSLRYILIIRVNNKGKLMPIDPCSMCAQKAKEIGVKIYTIRE